MREDKGNIGQKTGNEQEQGGWKSQRTTNWEVGGKTL